MCASLLMSTVRPPKDKDEKTKKGGSEKAAGLTAQPVNGAVTGADEDAAGEEEDAEGEEE